MSAQTSGIRSKATSREPKPPRTRPVLAKHIDAQLRLPSLGGRWLRDVKSL